ncbi:AAA family ATPase [Mycobacterium sp. 4D054]|uniref:AAA family ATPase n=1 Tax=Mycobacterium sp. 4D054 TaxID=3457440 RepID=UPI003FD33F64
MIDATTEAGAKAAIQRLKTPAPGPGITVPAEPAGTTTEPDTAITGAEFILDQPSDVPAIWGQGRQVMWAEGEALMIAGGQGLGKTTLAGLLLRALLGIGDGKVLGLPVADTGCRVLYLAMDRPSQASRSMARQFAEADRAVLARRVKFWKGPPPRDLAANPTLLARMAEHYNAGVVIVDSLKDAAVRLSEDAVGAQWNRARQHLLQQGRQLLELHHTVKRGPQGAPVAGVADIYGSTWLTSGCGSIVLLSGEPGDPIVKFKHVKQPAEEVGPYRLLHDQAAGEFSIEHSVDLVELVRATGVEGLTAREAAVAVAEKPQPGRADVEKARRRLDQMTAAGVLVRVDGRAGGGDGRRGGAGGRQSTAWFLAAEEQSREVTESDKTAGQNNHGLFDLENNHASITPITRNAKPQVGQSRARSRQSRAYQSRNPPPL